MALVRAVFLACLVMSTAHADGNPASSWIAQPATVATSGAAIRVGAGQVEDGARDFDTSMLIMMVARARLAVMRQVQLDLSLAGELGDDLVVLASPTVAGTWMTTIDESTRVAIRGIASPAITSGVTFMPPNRSGSLLAHDPLVAWSAAHSLALQAAVHGDAEVQWGVAASIIEIVPTELARHQTLLRIDAAVGGRLSPCWTWAAELGASSDVLDEEADEGTDIAPLWTAGVHHHRGDYAVGFTTTGGWVGGSRDDLVGPSVFIDMRGPL